MRVLVALVAALALSGCATVPRFEAAGDIHAFLVSIRDGDRATFEAHLDRPALVTQLKSRLIADQARTHGGGSWQALGAVLAGPLVDVAADQLIQPEVLRAVAVQLGYATDRPLPNQLEITAYLRLLDPDRVCAFTKKNGPCVLIFKHEDGGWKLIAFEGELKQPKLRF